MADTPCETANPPKPSIQIWRMPFHVALVLPAQLTVLSIVLIPTLIVIWLAFTDWQPTGGAPWYRAETVWFWNFYDLWYDERFVNAVLRTFFVVVVCVSAELMLALGLALLFRGTSRPTAYAQPGHDVRLQRLISQPCVTPAPSYHNCRHAQRTP